MKVKEKKHSEFVHDVLSLNKRPQLQKPSRTEPTLQISEFNLVKSVTGKEGGVRVNDLIKVLKKRAKHVEIGKKVTSAGRKGKTLPKPLEKPRAERIRRTVAFETVKKQLNRWDAVVTSNRASNRLTFPLPDTTLETSKTFTGFRIKSKLQKELEELDAKVEVFNLEKESEYPLTMQEMMERRKEMAKMRAVQSYKEAKARRQSKIKSKKYHRVQRREKIKQQMKEFEQLQKTNPGEALKKLEEIEQVRAEERASLRHRSTGKWARNKQVQAKYDKDSRQVLAQQLSLSRDLTQKLKTTGGQSESEEEGVNEASISKSSENNPWTNPIKTSSEVTEFLSGYRKFWENENKKPNQDNVTDSNDNVSKINEIADEEVQQENTVEMSTFGDEVSLNQNSQSEAKQKHELQLTKDNKMTDNENKTISNKNKTEQKTIKNKEGVTKPELTKQQRNKNNKILDNENKTNNKNKTEQKTIKKNKQLTKPELTTKRQRNKTKDTPRVGTSEWNITLLSDDDYNDEDEDIDTIFENVGNKLRKNLEGKYKKLKKEIEVQRIKTSKTKPKKLKAPTPPKKQIDLSLSNPTKRPIIDEQLLENDDNSNIKNNLAVLETILKNNSIEEEKPTTRAPIKNIDPNDIIKTKPVNLDTQIPDLLSFEDNEENENQKGTISEAFEDDDIIDEFKKDKRAEINAEKPQDINLALPGWGAWGGTGIKPSKRKNKRFIMKFPKAFKRRDENKGNLIINENTKAKIKPHLVSEVPFPFKKVKDFEASIRAPIGNTFVPETAFKRMIRPAVRTKMGTIIEPMNNEILLKKKK